MKLILIGVILITLFTNTTMAKNKKNINWRQIMTSDEAYTYTPPQKKKKSIWDNDWFKGNPAKRDYRITFSKGGKVK
jgi:hypothetical protein